MRLAACPVRDSQWLEFTKPREGSSNALTNDNSSSRRRRRGRKGKGLMVQFSVAGFQQIHVKETRAHFETSGLVQDTHTFIFLVLFAKLMHILRPYVFFSARQFSRFFLIVLPNCLGENRQKRWLARPQRATLISLSRPQISLYRNYFDIKLLEIFAGHSQSHSLSLGSNSYK